MEPSLVGFLDRIVADRRRRVAEMSARVPGHALRARLGPARPGGRLERALRRGPPAAPIKLLCEIKRASPSKGMLRDDLDPVAMARIYAAGGTAAISIVTEPDHFKGRLEWIDEVRAAVTLPLLLKDFVIDSYQLLDAATRGADGVLLIAALHSDVQIQRLVSEARSLGLDPLVEVHDPVELQRTLRAGATLVGINNRDLHSFEVNLETAERLLPAVPALVTAVAESGFSTPADLSRLRASRCDAALIGEALVTSADPAATLAAFLAAAGG